MDVMDVIVFINIQIILNRLHSKTQHTEHLKNPHQLKSIMIQNN